jgi:hypothetical protein
MPVDHTRSVSSANGSVGTGAYFMSRLLMIEPPGSIHIDGHDRLLLRELWVALRVDKMIEFIVCNHNLLPGFPQFTSAVTTTPLQSTRMLKTSRTDIRCRFGSQCLQVHVGVS